MQQESQSAHSPSEWVVPNAQMQQAMAHVYERDRTFQAIEAEAGPLTLRKWPSGFPSLVRIVLGQQLSARAAQAIFQRLNEQVTLTPEKFAVTSEDTLKQVGFSRAKIATCQRLANAILAQHLNLNTLPDLPDAQITEQLTQIKGIGVWTAEIYLLFCLDRLSSFPASDLAIQISYQRLKGLEQRPTRKELLEQTQDLIPYRGAIAHLLWHYYRHLAKR
jgi:DNA-3-methyladenine glycosylase II